MIVLLPQSIPALLIGVVLLDLAVQAVHVTNQSIIFDRYPKVRSRLAGGYMVFYSIGSAVGAITSTLAYDKAGWIGVSLFGAGFSALALLIWTASLHLKINDLSGKTRYVFDKPGNHYAQE